MMSQGNSSEPEGHVGLFEHTDFGGGSAHFQGPCGLMSLKDASFEGVSAKRQPVTARSASLTTGPNAWLLAAAEDCAASGCDEATFQGDRLYVGPNESINELKALGMDNEIRSVKIWSPGTAPELPSFRFAEPISCFLQLSAVKGSLSGGLLFEAPVEIPVLDWYRLYGPTKKKPALNLSTGPSTWVQLFPEEGFATGSDEMAPLFFEPDTIIRNLSAYYPGVKAPWIKSLRVWREEPSQWPGVSLPPRASRNIDKVVRKAINNSSLRSATKSAVETIPGFLGAPPGVGGGLGFLLGALWPNKLTPMRVWNELYEGVGQLASELVALMDKKALDEGLRDVQSFIEKYQSYDYGAAYKETAMTNLQGKLTELQNKFANPKSPETTLPYLVPLATIALAAHREELISYEALHSPKKLDDSTRTQAIQDLKDLLATFVQNAKDGRMNAIAWRKEQIKVETQSGRSFVQDSYDDWKSEDFSKGSPILQSIKAQREERIVNEYGAELDDFLNDAFLWPYMIPADAGGPKQPPQKNLRTADSGPFGGPPKSGRKDFVDDSGGQPVTRIRLWGGERVDGIEVFYGGKSAGRRGGEGGTRKIDCELEAGEVIVGGFGWDGGTMDQLVFRTNLGRELGVGNGAGSKYPWLAWGPGDGARLASISGLESPGALESLTLHWEYERYE